MSPMWTVFLKELKDFSRDRRTLMLTLLMGPLLSPLLIIGLSRLVSNRVHDQLEKPLAVPVIGAERAPNLVAWLQGQNIVVEPAPADPDEAIRSQAEDVILRIGEDYPKQWRGSLPAGVEIIHDSSREAAKIPVDRLEALLSTYSQTTGALRLVARGVSPGLGQAVRIAHRDLATPESRIGQALAFLPYLLILNGFLGGVALVIDLTAGERERQSLEPLLATPAHRGAIMSGKIACAVAVGLASLILTLLVFKLSFTFVPVFGMKLDVSFWTIARLLVVLTPIVLVGSCLLTFISAGAKSVKEAQSYMSVLMLLPLIPTIVLMVNPIKDQLWQFAVPFLAQNQLILKLVRGEAIASTVWLVYVVFGFGLGLALWWAAARRYHDERLAISA